MKKTLVPVAALALALAVASCGGNNNKKAAEEGGVPAYTVVNAEQVDLSGFTKDEDGFIEIFDGKTFNGWRGYGKDRVPSKWAIVDGCITFNGTGGGEAQEGDGGDIIFAHKFKNFIFEFEWKVEKAANSGVFYLAQEITTKNDKGEDEYEPIYISCPEYQILDNENHPDSFLGVDGNRKSSFPVRHDPCKAPEPAPLR